MIDVGLLRRRVRSAIDATKQTAAERRERTAAATRAYEQFVEHTATPAFRALANVLRAEGIPFEMMTPSGGLRLAPDRAREEGITLELDTSLDPPQPILIVTQSRGSRMLRLERHVKEGSPIDQITDEDLIVVLLEQIKPWLG